MIKKLTLTAKQRKWLSILAVIGGVYTLAGFFLLPAVLRYMLPELLRNATGRNGGVAAVAFDPYRLNLQLRDFELQEKNGSPFVTFAELYVDFDAWRSLQHRMLAFSEVRLMQPIVHIEKSKAGAFNYDDLLPAAGAETPEIPLLPFDTGLLQIRGGALHWLDRSYPEASSETIKPINLELKGLTTRPQSGAALNLSLALVSGATLDWAGKVTLDPLSSEGRIHVRELKSRHLWEWFFRGNELLVLNKGANEIDAQYRFDYSREQMDLKLAPLLIDANNLGISEKGEKEPFIDVQALKLRDAELQLQWLQTGGQWQIKAPRGRLDMKKFALANPRKQKLRVGVDELALQGLGFDLLFKDTLQFNVAHQKIAVKKPSFALEGKRPLKINAAAVDFGPTRFSAKQASSHGALELKAEQHSLNLQKLSITLPAQRETLLDVAAITAGKVRFALHPRDKAAPQINMSQDKFTAKQLVLREAGQTEALLSVAAATAAGVQFDLDKKLIKITAAQSDGSEIKAWLDDNGTFNYQTLFFGGGAAQLPLPPISQAVESQSAKTKPPLKNEPPPLSLPKPPLSAKEPFTPTAKWTTVIDKLTVNNGTLNFQDRSRKPQAAFKLAAVNITAENLNSATAAKIPLRFSALFNDSGKIDVNGNAVLKPFSAAFDVKIEQFPLKPFQPYVNRFARLDVLSGALRVDGKLALDMTNFKQPQVSFKGAIGIDQFHSRDQLLHKDFAKWERFALQDVAFDLQPLRLDIAAVQVDQPYLRVAIGKQRSVNLADIVVKHETSDKPGAGDERSESQRRKAKARQSAGEAEKTTPMAFSLKKIKLREGRSDFSDFSLIIPFIAFIDHLDGMLSGLSSQRDAEASLRLHGSVLDMAPVDVDGDFQPYRGVSKVALSFRNLPLPAATPYMAEFAGYKIEKGQMSLDLTYQIAKGRLQANNKILIDQLVLGEKVNSPRALALPLELAIALLKDAQGKIKLDFPITGSLEDPKFSIRALLADALANVISKVVTSPFRTIAALIGREDEDMGQVAFQPGSAALSEAEIAKLDGLAKAFAERTALRLDIKGAAYQQQDWPELTDDALREQLEERRARELRSKGEIHEAEDIELSQDEYRRLLADLFIEKFPQLAKRSLLGTPKLINDDNADFYVAAEQKLREQIPPDTAMLNALAAERGQAIAKYLLRQKGIDGKRIFLLDAKVEPKIAEHGIVTMLFLRGS